MSATVEQLCAEIGKAQLLSTHDLANLRAKWFRPERKDAADADKFCQWLVLNHYLSALVVRVLRQGNLDRLLVGGYRVFDQLRAGPLAGAYVAMDALQRQVLIEVLAPGRSPDPALVQKFEQAARKAKQLEHPNVARVLDVGKVEDVHYLVREYAKGESLLAILAKRGRLAPGQAARIFALALGGAAACHEQGVSPGHLTLDHLVLTPQDKPARGHTLKIIDAGMRRRPVDAQLLGGDDVVSLLQPARQIGYLDLSAPAEVEPRPEQDLFRIGCALYHCLAGRPPYPPEVLPEPREAAPPLRQVVPEVPEMLADLVDQLVSPDPRVRPRQATHAAKLLRVFLASEEEPKEKRAEETVAAPVREQEPSAEEPEETGGPAAVGSVAALWQDLRPGSRDLVFLGIGSVSVIALVLLVMLLTGWEFLNVVCLLTGGALTYAVEKLLRWREQRTAS
jgi:serine/threonine-protein kinase